LEESGSAVANFIHGRGEGNVGDDVYLEQIGFAVEEYPKALPFIPELKCLALNCQEFKRR
jgi:intergrase/recombinase